MRKISLNLCDEQLLKLHKKKAGDIFFYGWLVPTFFQLYGSLVFEKSDYMGGGYRYTVLLAY